MSNVDTLLDELVREDKQVESWRWFVLQQAGYSEEVAYIIARSNDVDLHQAVELLESGCDEGTALDILY